VLVFVLVMQPDNISCTGPLSVSIEYRLFNLSEISEACQYTSTNS
jgi:hypothetical protein